MRKDSAFANLDQLAFCAMQCGESDPDLFFTDRPRDGGLGQRNKEYISIWADDAPGVLCGRSPMQCYEDFMQAFKETFQQVRSACCAPLGIYH